MSEVENLGSWRALRDWLMARTGSEWVFRGMGDAKWEIQSSAERAFGSEYNHRAEEALSLYHSLLKRRFPDLAPSGAEEMEAFAQHHGLPTRLVDWSESPYVAACFAFWPLANTSRSAPSHVAIWALDTSILPTAALPAEVSLVEVAGSHNKRLDAQYGLFTKVRGAMTLDQALDIHDHADRLVQLRLSTRHRSEAWADLRRMGIGPDRLFPDPEGLAQRVVWDMS